MSDLLLNLRLGYLHFQLTHWPWRGVIKFKQYLCQRPLAWLGSSGN